MNNTEVAQRELGEGDRYRLLVDGIVDYAIYMLDPKGIVVSWNAGAQRFKGYAASEIIGRHFSLFYSEQDRRDGLPARALEIAATEGKFEREGWRIRKDGSKMWAHVLIDPIRDASGELIGFAKVTRDISERKAAQEALKRSEEQFGLLVQSVTDYALYMLDPEGRISSWNQGAQRIKGYLAEEIIGQHFSRFYTEEDRAKGEPQKALQTAANQGRYEKEGWRVRKDGTRFWANVVVDTIRDNDGTILGFAKVTRDITERTEAQRALEQAREAFFQSQKADALGKLTGGIAHDFNNLLMVILSSLELVRKRLPDDPKIARLIDNAVQGAQRGASLTQRMLAFARKQELASEVVSLPDLVRGMLDMLERSLGPAVAVDIEFPIILEPALADANQLELALLNLAVNARDAMPEGGSITISAREEHVLADNALHLATGQYVCLSVTDRGAGMDDETLARASEPFFTTKGVGKGTGLGLSMVQGMAEQSGGRLVLKSQKDVGTTAEIWLPAARQPAGAAESGRRVERMEPHATSESVILAVDDDSLVLNNVAEMLEDLGYQVLLARSGKEALELIRTAPRLDLLITDQAMPNMTGTQLVQAVQTLRPGLAAILATGYADLAASEHPDLPRLMKPFRQHDLAQAVTRVLKVPSL